MMFNANEIDRENKEKSAQHALPSESAIPQNSNWQIVSEQAGLRLDRYLAAQISTLSRTAAQQLIEEGAVQVNGKTSKAGYILRANDEVHIQYAVPSAQQKNVQPQALPLEIVYEDADLLVVNKAAGMVVHPAPGHSDDTLVNALVARYPELQPEEGDLRPGIVHRLDRDTSGLLLVARNVRAQAALIDQMKRHEVTKRYLALVQGIVTLEKGSIDAPIGRNPRNRQQMAITAQDGREARTHFRVLERYSRHTLLLLQLETGRTHQIRVHLQAIGHPVVGDPVYTTPGRAQAHLPLTRQFLHAYQLEFVHPASGETLKFEAPLPEDLAAVLERQDLL